MCSFDKNAIICDLHRLSVIEAKTKIYQYLDGYKNKKLFFISGKGLHSRNGFPAIKENLLRILQDRGYPHEICKRNAGRVHIYPDDTTDERCGWSGREGHCNKYIYIYFVWYFHCIITSEFLYLLEPFIIIFLNGWIYFKIAYLLVSFSIFFFRKRAAVMPLFVCRTNCIQFNMKQFLSFLYWSPSSVVITNCNYFRILRNCFYYKFDPRCFRGGRPYNFFFVFKKKSKLIGFELFLVTISFLP